MSGFGAFIVQRRPGESALDAFDRLVGLGDLVDPDDPGDTGLYPTDVAAVAHQGRDRERLTVDPARWREAVLAALSRLADADDDGNYGFSVGSAHVFVSVHDDWADVDTYAASPPSDGGPAVTPVPGEVLLDCFRVSGGAVLANYGDFVMWDLDQERPAEELWG